MSPASELELVETPCPLCAGDRRRPLHRVEAEPPAPPGPWTLVRCLDCASDYLRPRPRDPLVLYAPGYHVHRAARGLSGWVQRAAARREARRIGRLVPRGSAVFEIGCGSGLLLAALARRGFVVSGIEPSRAAVAAARARGLSVGEGSFDGGRGVAGGYDLVVAAHVLEHVADPRAFVAELRRILRPGGLVVIKTPVAGSLDALVFGGHSGAYDVPYHLSVPSRAALRALAAASGLEVADERDDAVPNDWVHGLRKSLRLGIGLPLPFVRPWNPLVSLPLLPVSLAASALGGASRVRFVLRKPVDVDRH